MRPLSIAGCQAESNALFISRKAQTVKNVLDCLAQLTWLELDLQIRWISQRGTRVGCHCHSSFNHFPFASLPQRSLEYVV